MKKKQLLIIGICAAILALLVAAALIIPSLISDQANDEDNGSTPSISDQSGSPEAEQNKNEKNITFTVVYENGESKKFSITTEKQYLAEALLDEGLITEAEFKTGFYTIIDDVEAVWANDSAWWCITKDGVMTEKGMNETKIGDGDSFEATYTKG
ncbi:MAG: DUF4430 domain-containing protein [Ruminococcaceae bacterium]|nr:DUF4430 domain-containing protein [Oscillospiraceae bacterium]